jgi:hypothetical protein
MPWEKNVGGKWIPQPTCDPASAAQLSRELHKRHRREGAVARKVLRLARAARRRRAWRPPIVHGCPISTPRPRERGARMVAASGRNGDGARDDGGGPADSDGGGAGSDPPPHPQRLIAVARCDRDREPLAGGAS